MKPNAINTGYYQKEDNHRHTQRVSDRFFLFVLVLSFASEEWIIHLGKS